MEVQKFEKSVSSEEKMNVGKDKINAAEVIFEDSEIDHSMFSKEIVVSKYCFSK